MIKKMIEIAVKNLEGKDVEKMELNPKVFGVEMNENLVHQVYVCLYANQRKVISHTKDKGDRKGSGRKPWKQKGTGRARTGSVRNPIWRKGGVIFGPNKEANYSKKINKKMNQKALKMVLSGKAKDNEIIVVDKFNYQENKTKEAAKLLESSKIKGSILWAYSPKDKDKMKVSRNLDKVKNAYVDNLNVFNILNSRNLIIEKEELKKLEERLIK